jgi:peptidoglycan hydrolase-like protein with peptidoglycan-binding domain
LETKDQEIEGLKEALNKAGQAKETSVKIKVVPEVKSRPSVKQVQIALKNSGYNPGYIDGRMGRQTKEAIKAFQKDNNLPIDGKVGKETWNLLKGYLYKKVK